MLTPTFTCTQDEKFIIITIVLSAICKARDSVFDICGNQFTFYCSPYYLRLRFNQSLREGSGERATFDVESEQLVVYLPKASPGETFDHLGNPQYLLATEKQQKKMTRRITEISVEKDPSHLRKKGNGKDVEEIDSVPSSDDSSEDIDFDQAPRIPQNSLSHEEEKKKIGNDHHKCTQDTTLQGGFTTTNSGKTSVMYGFGNGFSGLFERLDADLAAEIMELPIDCIASPHHRRTLRLEKENADFCLEELITSTEEEEDAITALLQYVPAHMRDFQKALSMEDHVAEKIPGDISTRKNGEEEEQQQTTIGPYPAQPNHLAPEALEEEEEKEFAGEKGGEIWHGNVFDFPSPSTLEEGRSASTSSTVITTVAEPLEVPVTSSPQTQEPKVGRMIIEMESSSTDSHIASHPRSPSGSLSSPTLAIPNRKPLLEFSREEQRAIMVAKLPPLLFPPSKLNVLSLTVDILLAEAYDDVFSEGNGCCESVWNICKLSPSLSFLDTPETLYDACYFFARRMFTYPLYRHGSILMKVFAMVGTRMMLGTRYVIRSLLRVRQILSRSDHRHIFCTIFIDPLVAYWVSVKDGDVLLLQGAKELHEHATRKTAVVVKKNSKPLSLEILCQPGLSTRLYNGNLLLKPLLLQNLDFPLDDEEEDSQKLEL